MISPSLSTAAAAPRAPPPVIRSVRAAAAEAFQLPASEVACATCSSFMDRLWALPALNSMLPTADARLPGKDSSSSLLSADGEPDGGRFAAWPCFANTCSKDSASSAGRLDKSRLSDESRPASTSKARRGTVLRFRMVFFLPSRVSSS